MNWWANPHTFRLFLFHPRMTVCWEIEGAMALSSTGAEIGFEPMTFWVWARRATNCATLLGCSTRRGRAWPHNPIIDKIIALPGRASVPGRIWTGDPRIKSSLRLPTALQERLTTNAQRTKKYFSFSCAPLSTLRIYYSIKFEKCQIFKSD